jgi:hypothetical protein
MPSALINILHTYHIDLLITLGGRYCYVFYFADGRLRHKTVLVVTGLGRCPAGI